MDTNENASAGQAEPRFYTLECLALKITGRNKEIMT